MGELHLAIPCEISDSSVISIVFSGSRNNKNNNNIIHKASNDIKINIKIKMARVIPTLDVDLPPAANSS